MKKTALKSVALLSIVSSCVALGSSVALAQEGDKKEVTKSVVPYGLIQGYLNLFDSQRQNTPDFSTVVARIGFKATEGVVKGQIEAGLVGNSNDEKQVNNIAVRRADLTLALPSKTSISMGRVRPGGAGAWGVDATTSTGGFGYLDGLWIGQTVDVSEGNTVSLGLGYGNALTAPASKYNHAFVASDATVHRSYKQEKALIVKAEATVAGVKGTVYYGMEDKQYRKAPVTGVAPDTTKIPIVVGVAEVKAEVAPVSHLEASLGYDLDNLGAGVWFQRIIEGKGKVVTGNEGGKLIVGEKVGVITTSTVIGVGVNGDSSFFDVADLLQKGDKLTYGASYAMSMSRVDSVSAEAKKIEKDADVSLIAVGGGYAAGGYGLELNIAHELTKANSYGNTKGEPGKSKSATTAYVAGVYSF